MLNYKTILTIIYFFNSIEIFETDKTTDTRWKDWFRLKFVLGRSSSTFFNVGNVEIVQ